MPRETGRAPAARRRLRAHSPDVVCLAEEYRTAGRARRRPIPSTRIASARPTCGCRSGRTSASRRSIRSAARLSQALGREYLDQGRADLAERAFKDAIGRDATLADVHLALARIYLADGRLDEAARAVARTLALAPDSKDARALQAAIDAARTPR